MTGASGRENRGFVRPSVSTPIAAATIRTRVSALWTRGTRMVLASDLALTYGAIVAAIGIGLACTPDATHDRIIEVCSTNLANLRNHPLWVLFASAFVTPSLFGLWQLVLLLPLYAAAQQWVGRAATIVVALIGHVGATLLVATVLANGIFHGWISRSVIRVDDVGISYGLAGLTGFLLLRVPAPWRWLYLAVAIGYFALPLAYAPSFTSLGHTTALTLGVALSLVAYRAATAARDALLRADGSSDS